MSSLGYSSLILTAAESVFTSTYQDQVQPFPCIISFIDLGHADSSKTKYLNSFNFISLMAKNIEHF